LQVEELSSVVTKQYHTRGILGKGSRKKRAGGREGPPGPTVGWKTLTPRMASGENKEKKPCGKKRSDGGPKRTWCRRADTRKASLKGNATGTNVQINSTAGKIERESYPVSTYENVP